MHTCIFIYLEDIHIYQNTNNNFEYIELKRTRKKQYNFGLNPESLVFE
jgi:hypothetical protein